MRSLILEEGVPDDRYRRRQERTEGGEEEN